MKRMGMIFRAKANKALDRAEDPRETLDYSYQKQLELLQKVRRGVADVATSRKRLELQLNQLQGQSAKLEDQGRKASPWAARTSPVRPCPGAPRSSSRSATWRCSTRPCRARRRS